MSQSIYRRGRRPSCSSTHTTTSFPRAAEFWPRIQAIAEEVGLLANLKAIVQAARAGGLRVCIAPHRRWEPGDYRDWLHPNPTQIGIMKRHSFARGEWGGEWHPDFAPQPGDIVAKEHWGQSGFANTDLDQQLRQHGVTTIILVGLLANTCIEFDGALHDGAGLPRHTCPGCDRRVHAGDDACRA